MALAAIIQNGSRPLNLAGIPIDGLPGPVELRVNIPDQQRSNWCWSAVAVGIANAYSDPLTQCFVASAVNTKIKNKPVKCCMGGSKTDCNAPRRLSLALTLPTHVHLVDRDFSTNPPETSWKFITESIEAGRPIAIRIGFPKTASGHVVAITGCDHDLQGGRHVLIGDPSSLTGSVPHAKLVKGYLGGFWHSTYLTTGNRRVPRK